MGAGEKQPALTAKAYTTVREDHRESYEADSHVRIAGGVLVLEEERWAASAYVPPPVFFFPTRHHGTRLKRQMTIVR